MAGTKVKVRGSWEGDPTDPGWYVKCQEAWIGPYADKAKAAERSIMANSDRLCDHTHKVVPVGLQGDTAPDTLKP